MASIAPERIPPAAVKRRAAHQPPPNVMEDAVNIQPAPSKARSRSALPFCIASVIAGFLNPTAVHAQDQTTGTAAAPPTLQPAISPTLSPNPKPYRYDLGDYGPVYATGILSGFGQIQSNRLGPDHRWRFDVDNGQVFLNKPDGPVQFFVQLGYYALPALGTPYLPAGDATPAFFMPVPQAYLKIAPMDNLSVMIGKLPTLVGAESTFTYQNMNIQRGLLWNQENAVNRGVQVNYAQGPMSFSLAVNDGFYSGRPSWISGLASYAIDKSNTVTFVGAGNSHNDSEVSSTRTPLFQNNQQIYNLIYTRTDGPWTLQPYLQYSHVPHLPQFGAPGSASTFGGAVLASYDFGADAVPTQLRLPGFKLAGRVEYIDSSGSPGGGAPNLLYGPGSAAWSLTVTPTYQYRNFFARGEVSWVGTHDAVPGAAFGTDGNKGTQVRGLVEVGLLF
jgi:hypothetical protein